MPDAQTPSFKFQLSSSSSFRDNRGSQIYSRGPCTPWTPPSGKMLTDPSPEVLAYIYITVKFQIRSSINMRLAESSVIIDFALNGPPKWGFGMIWGRVKIFGGKVHPSSQLRVFRHLWSRSDSPCSSYMYGYSHLP